MNTTPKEKAKQWRPGDLALLVSDPKVHRMLMEVLEVKGHRAKTAYLDPRCMFENWFGASRGQAQSWHRLDELQDPNPFLKTEEFSQTLRERSRLRLLCSA